MDYGPDWPPPPELEQAGFPPMNLWKRIIAYSIIPTLALWILGEVILYVHGTVHLDSPAARTSVPHVTTVLTPTPNGEHR